MTLWCADTSVVVPAVLTSHDAHRAVLGQLGRKQVRLPLHAAIESYSVLTRLPGDARLTPADAALLLSDRFGQPVELPSGTGLGLLAALAELRLAGGAVYDALIAVTAREAAATLLTRDRRAAATYALIGVAHQFVG